VTFQVLLLKFPQPISSIFGISPPKSPAGSSSGNPVGPLPCHLRECGGFGHRDKFPVIKTFLGLFPLSSVFPTDLNPRTQPWPSPHYISFRLPDHSHLQYPLPSKPLWPSQYHPQGAALGLVLSKTGLLNGVVGRII
jgi:hypothetical protein